MPKNNKGSRSDKQAALMASKGYLALPTVARALGLSHQTVAMWVEAGKVKAIRVASRVYLEEKSVVAHVGQEATKLLGVGAGQL